MNGISAILADLVLSKIFTSLIGDTLCEGAKNVARS